MNRNKEIKKILKSREIAKKQNFEQSRKIKSIKRPRYLEGGFVKSSVWPSNKRMDQ
jgi:hypothetical protein